MNAISQTFTFNQSNNVRIVLDENGAPMFVAKDVAIALGYSNTKDALSRHCRGVVKHYPLQTKGGLQNVRVIYEPDVYALIFGSKLPSAVKFQDWVFNEVLPTIRKTGSYQPTQPVPVTKPVPTPEPREYLTHDDMVNIKRLVYTVTNGLHYQTKLNYAIWHCLRQATGVPSPAKFEVHHLPVIAREFERIYAILLPLRDSIADATQIIVQRILRGNEDHHPLGKLLCQQIIDSANQYADNLTAQHKRYLGQDINALLMRERLTSISNLYEAYGEPLPLTA